VRRAALVLFVLLATPVPASGQQDSILGEAMRLATEGQGDSARAFTQGYLQRLSPNDSLYPEALYTAGVVAGSTADQQMYLRRVSIEFSQSSWADDALLRLAQIAFAEQDFAGALRAAERVVLDYPFSNVFAEANYWAGRSGLELGNCRGGGGLGTLGGPRRRWRVRRSGRRTAEHSGSRRAHACSPC
jgi:TolA-binding protein